VLGAHDIVFETGEPPPAAAATAGTPGDAAAEAPGAAALTDEVREREREIILATLAATDGSRKNAAQRLGISPRTLRYKLAQIRASGVAIP